LLWERVFAVNAGWSDMARAIVIDEVRGSLYVTGDHFSIKFVLVDNVAVPVLDTDIFVEKLNPVDGSSLWDFPFFSAHRVIEWVIYDHFRSRECPHR